MKINKKHKIILLLLVVVVIIFGWVVTTIKGGGGSGGNRLTDERSNEKDSDLTKQKNELPDLVLDDYLGNETALGELIGRPLVINVWATWCPFCVNELNGFAAVQREFEGEVTIVAIDRSEPKKTAMEYTNQLGISDDLLWLLDDRDAFYQAVGGWSMPETLFVDKNGQVIFHKRGPMETDEIRARVQSLIAQQ